MDGKDPLASDIAVFSKDPEKQEEKKPNGDVKGKGKDDSKDEPEIVRCYQLYRLELASNQLK